MAAIVSSAASWRGMASTTTWMARIDSLSPQACFEEIIQGHFLHIVAIFIPQRAVLILHHKSRLTLTPLQAKIRPCARARLNKLSKSLEHRHGASGIKSSLRYVIARSCDRLNLFLSLLHADFADISLGRSRSRVVARERFSLSLETILSNIGLTVSSNARNTSGRATVTAIGRKLVLLIS